VHIYKYFAYLSVIIFAGSNVNGLTINFCFLCISRSPVRQSSSFSNVPVNNFDFNIGLNDGFKYTLNVQPVIPVSLNNNWNLISRIILPVVSQSDIINKGSTIFGLSDVIQSMFFSPAEFTANGIIWGVDPVFLLPTATKDFLGAKKWGVGPTVVMLKQIGSWTIGLLGNHI